MRTGQRKNTHEELSELAGHLKAELLNVGEEHKAGRMTDADALRRIRAIKHRAVSGYQRTSTHLKAEAKRRDLQEQNHADKTWASILGLAQQAV